LYCAFLQLWWHICTTVNREIPVMSEIQKKIY